MQTPQMITDSTLISIADAEGRFARFDPREYADESRTHILIHPESGGQLLVERGLILQDKDLYLLRANLSDLLRVGMTAGEVASIPVVQEEAQFSKRVVEGGTVRIHKRVHTDQVTFDEPLYVDRVDVRRAPMNTPITGDAPQPRYEGETWVIPVVEEVLVVEKRLVLVEEIYVSRERVAVHSPQQVELRREEVVVERLDERGRRVSGDDEAG